MTTEDYSSGNAAPLRLAGKLESICVREFDAEWTITRVNAAHCVLFDCGPGDLVGRKAWSLMDGKFAQDEQQRFLTLLLKERRHPVPFCYTERLGDGTLLPVRVDWCYRHDNAGEIIGFIWWLERLDAGTGREIVPGGRPYKELLDALHDGVGLVHRNGSFTYVNKRLCEILGVDKRALVGRSIFSLGDEQGKRTLAAARAAGERGKIEQCEVTHRHPSGKRICLLVSGRPVKSQIGSMDPGQDVTSLMVVTDITPGWRAETMRRRQAQIFDEIHDAILVLNSERVIVDCSASAERLFGYEKRELIGRPAYALQSPRARRPQEPEIGTALLEHGRWGGEIQISRPAGPDLICDVNIGPFRDDDGRVIGYISVSRDVTARKKAERALSDSEARYRQLVEEQREALVVQDQAGEIAFANNAAAAFCRAKTLESLRQDRRRTQSAKHVRRVGVHGGENSEQECAEGVHRLQAALLENMAEGVGLVRPRDGSIVYANPKLEQMLGYEQGALLGANVGLLVERGKVRQFTPIIAALEGSGNWTGEIECRAKSGTPLWCRGIFSTFDHLDHGVVWVGVFADISEQKQANEDLRVAKDEAVRANLAKSRFLASASHDLRQPLHASNLFLAALADARSKKERDEIIDDLGTALLSMGSLLHDLLEISKLEAQVVRPEIADFCLRGLMTRLATEFGILARKKGIEFRAVTSGVTVRSDMTLLGRILSNFLANAVQYTDRGKILFGCRRVGAHVRIAVWDTGGGVPIEAQDMIFEEFYQHRPSRRERNPGLGLGLAIVKRTVDLLGHQTAMVSRLGKGSMFAVDVPVGSVEGQAVEAIRWSVAVNGDVAGTSMVVLEDDPAVRKATEKVLKAWGASVIAVDSSDAAIAEITRVGVCPNVLIADYRLAEETGLAAAQRIRDVCDSEIPTIILTGDPTATRLAEITRTGATAMRKPVKPAELRLAIRETSRRRD